MRNRVERLRVWLLGSAVFLLVVIAAFIGSARYLRRHFLANLPAKLGLNIVRETNGFTDCKTNQGRTEYCIHASKSFEHTDGKITLHDVSIVLYGKKGDRNDRIQSDEFEYDKDAGVVRATGVVHIDVQAAGQTSDAKVMHVTTSGLVYLQKLGVAATSEPIEFETTGITGHAIGADYASDSGVLVLHSAVDMAGITGKRRFAVTAATAEFDDRSQEAFLTRAVYESEGRTASADQSTLHRRPDGTLSRIEAQGNVTLEAKGATVVSQRADVALTAKSQPQTAVLTGGVKYTADEPLRQLRGQSDAATVEFDSKANPQPQHAVFTGSVHMTERVRASEAAKQPWSTRDLTAAKVVTELAAVGPGQSQLRDAEATGNPRLVAVNNGTLASNSGAGTTELSADDLKAHMLPTTDAKQPPQLDTIAGRGHTVLRQMTVDGVEQTSAGDSLDAKFRPRVADATTKGSAPANTQLTDALLSAVQQGHVTMTRRAPAKGVGAKPAGSVDVEHASAERAVYDGDADRVTLTGNVQVLDSGSVLWANQVALDHKTGDTHAAGAVKMNYVQEASARPPAHNGGAGTSGATSSTAQPTHVLAERADLDHETDVATFYGRPVRLWQGGNQVLAPVIEFSQAQKRLIARGDAQTGWSAAVQAAQVHTVLTGAESDAAGAGGQGSAKSGSAAPGCASAAPAAGTGKGGAAAAAPTPSVVQVASGGLVYSEILRQADFTGGFRADTADGTIRGNDGTVYLKPRAPASDGAQPANQGAAPSGPTLAGDLDRLVAVGHVELDKPGLKATGTRLVYTASDRTALLTGDKDTPPKAVDSQGTTTGAVLRFRSSCDGSGSGTVEVLGAPGQRAHTDAEITNDGKKEKGKR